MVTEAEARQRAQAHLAVAIDDHGASVDVEAVDGGWRAVVALPPGSEPLIGLGQVYVTDDGQVIGYPSSFSPRMAREAFAARDDAPR